MTTSARGPALNSGIERWVLIANIVLVTTLSIAVVALCVLAVIKGDAGREEATDAVMMPLFVVSSVFAFLIVSRQPAHRIGWGMAVTAVLGAILGLSGAYAHYSVESNDSAAPGTAYAAWLFDWLWVWVLMAPITLLFVFVPNGTLQSSRWRWVAWLDLITLLLLSVTQALLAGPMESNPTVHNPFGVEVAKPVILALNMAGFLLLIPSVCLSATALTVRFRQSHGRERLQLKWLTSAAAGAAMLFVVSWMVSLTAFDIWDFSTTLAFALTPAAAAVAILRHRLYDIDVIINRTLVYGSLTAATVGSYLVLVVSLGWIARAVTGQGSNELAIAATTLIVAGLFQPARRRIQAVVDRRFYRSRYDALRVVDAFQGRLRDQVDLESLRRDLAATVTRSLEPSFIAVWIRPGGGQ